MTTVTMDQDTKKRSPKTLRPIPVTTKKPSEIEDLLIKARIKMLINAPFFGNLATRLRFKDATEWLPTIATDGRYFYYNRDFVAALKDEEVVFGMGHEVLHCVYDHMDKGRLGNRDPKLWNIANDYVINADLIDAGIGEKITLVEICYDWKYRGKVSEEIYDDLFEEAKRNGRVINMDTFDEHIFRDGDSDDDGAGEGEDNDGSKGPVRYTKAEKDQIRQEFQNAVVQAAKVAGAGNIPSGVRRLLQDLLNPQLDWRELLAMQIQSVVKSDYTYMRPSRKGLDAGLYLPGMDRETTIDVAIAIDMSGSITDEMGLDFLSEVNGIMSQYNDFNIRLWCFDTKVYNPTVITADTASDLLTYELAGGGGTDFDVNFEYMKEQGLVPKKFIMFTDGYPWGSWGDENYCDTLFIVHGNKGDKIPESPFGITVPYTRSGK
jgi:predicted metal-dependent peptidase